MSLIDLTKKNANRVIGIDCSTNSLAFAIFEGGVPVSCGEIVFKGADIYERLNDARRKTQALVDQGILVADYVGMEAAIMVNNRQVVIKLSYIYGTVLSVLMQNKMRVETVPPITWQTAIGNPNLKKFEKDDLRIESPGKSASWYQNEGRKLRKQRTLGFARKFFKIKDDSDNVGDAVGVAWYVNNYLTKRV